MNFLLDQGFSFDDIFLLKAAALLVIVVIVGIGLLAFGPADDPYGLEDDDDACL